MTPERLAEIKAREKAATLAYTQSFPYDSKKESERLRAIWVFESAARQDIPDLIAEVESNTVGHNYRVAATANAELQLQLMAVRTENVWLREALRNVKKTTGQSTEAWHIADDALEGKT